MTEGDTRKIKHVAIRNPTIKDGKYGTGLIWPHVGFVHDVPTAIAVKMAGNHPDMWKDVTDGDEGEGPKDLADAMEAPGGEPSPLATQPALHPNQEFSKDRKVALVQAIGMLNHEDPDDYGKNGKPHVAAIEAQLGYDVSADERDDAFNRFATATQGL